MKEKTRVYLTAYITLKLLHQTHNLQIHSPLNTSRTAGRSLENSALMRFMGSLAMCHFTTEFQKLSSRNTHARTHTRAHTHTHTHTHTEKYVLIAKYSTRQAINVYRNIEARSYRCCGGKAMSVTYSVCMFVALVIQRAMLMRLIVICALPDCTIFFHITS